MVKEFQSEVMVADCMERRRRSCWGEKSGCGVYGGGWDLAPHVKIMCAVSHKDCAM